MVQFIKALSVRDAHYSRKKTVRQYLSAELSVAALYRMLKEKQDGKGEAAGSLALFKSVFYGRFNPGFGTPATDRWSMCMMLQKKIDASEDVEENTLQLRLHEKKAARYYQIVRESRLECSTISVVFDMQQNQPLPKLGIGEEYYKRQIWFYNLDLCIQGDTQTRNNISFYTWCENESGKGSNEICSALFNFLCRIRKRADKQNYKNLDLICDSCPGQNKNHSLLLMLLRFVNSPFNLFDTVRVIFPVRGHSYSAADRIFGRVERQYRKITRFCYA